MDEEKKRIDVYGRMRWGYRRQCPVCENIFYKQRSDPQKYCSHECSHIGKRTRLTLNCSFCGKETIKHPSKVKKYVSDHVFCSVKCRAEAQSFHSGSDYKPSAYKQGEYSYRQIAFRHYEVKCCKCGYSEIQGMLDVDHIDSNRSNNAIENLQILCVWCHALKTRKVDFHLREN